MTKSIATLHEELLSKKLTVRELCDDSLKTIREKDGGIGAFLGIYTDTLIEEQIKKAEEMFALGTASALTGIPFAIKDNILVKGEIASAGSKILEHYTAVYDADVIEALKSVGAILIGRTNMDEFAMGGSTENSAYKMTKNPHDLTKVAGGSSGGSAAAVAGGMTPAALGSDTGGSIRQPASFCGVVGLKTTYGKTSRFGAIAMGSSLDQIGPFGNSVTDVETIYNVISRHDKRDSTSLPESSRTFTKKVTKTIGVPWSFVRREGIDAEVLANFEESLKKLEKDGYTVKDVTIHELEKILSVYYIIMFAEVSSNLARYDGIRYGLSEKGANSIEGYFLSRTKGFGDEVRRRILLGTYVLSSGYYDAYYNKATALREYLRTEFAKVFKEVDVIALPTSPVPAFGVGEKHGDPLSMYLADIFTVPVNIVGVPAISIPSGKTARGLPLGLQLIAPHNGEEFLFTTGKDFEKVY
jgi:aspartyl-tRNA(Asn)/glutamyl-tRNA(Gln) amidotransferase subunit A